MNLIGKTFSQTTQEILIKTILIGSVGVLGFGVVTDSVMATVNATAFNTTAQPISTGELTVTMAAGSGSTGFGSTFSGMVPGDSRTVYVDIAQGTSASTNPQIQIVDTPTASATLLSSDATRGLAVTINGCATAWSSGSCSGGSFVVLASTPLLTLKTITNLSASYLLTASTTNFLQFVVTLPNGLNETRANGGAAVVSGGSGTIQGLSANIIWTLSVQQRAANGVNA
jgi:hypothetical protein